ncbi:phosphotransferase [Phyllobacterium zundukense]|uniref:Aminoglycoside phosphotransferase domain-containing protein n=1 Tax=Phyllobacterium zundukense TaxID=1867719 RepID=A0A2N9VY71_9HYPH|nr:phosphotransferase [Phyllobacterium zundukense]ATU94079.1 hypothetical protein BLM14_20030 [Phyllobacterium zundukense]PIO44439.1 hypothetical protein B5P45_12820 [Phyllobacterium zundukense]
MTDIDCDWLSSMYGRHFADLHLVVPGVNRTYRLHDEMGVSYLRLYREFGRPRPQIAAELDLLEVFPEQPEVEISRPIRTRDGALLIDLTFEDRHRQACLFRAIEGKDIDITPDGIKHFGQALASLHVAMPTKIDGAVRRLDPSAIGKDTLEAIKAISGSSGVSEEIEHEFLTAFEKLQTRFLPQGLCHGDAWTGNARVNDGKVGFFDFDDFGQGALVLDLGTAAWHLHGENSSQRDHLIDALVSGYEKVRPLSDAERESLPLFVQFAEVRSLRFLAKHCLLGEEMWSEVFRRAMKTFRC